MPSGPAGARAGGQGLDARGRGPAAAPPRSRAARPGAGPGGGVLLREVGGLPRRRGARHRRAPDAVVFTVDHHRGSEEIQPGWEHHDPDVVDPRPAAWTRCRFLRRTLAGAGLEERRDPRRRGQRDGRRALAHPAVDALHRRRARRGLRPGRLLRLGPLARPRRSPGDPRRVRAPGGRRPGAVPRLAAGPGERLLRRPPSAWDRCGCSPGPSALPATPSAESGSEHRLCSICGCLPASALSASDLRRRLGHTDRTPCT